MKDSRLRQDQQTPPNPPRGALAVDCPRCKAKVSEPCKGKNGKPCNFHAARQRKAGERSFVEQIEHAQRQLPDEVPEFVAGAAMVLRYAGLPVTRGSVRARLKATGRDRETLAAEMVGSESA